MENRNKKDVEWQGIHIFLAILAWIYTLILTMFVPVPIAVSSFVVLAVYMWMLHQSAVFYAEEEGGLAFFLSVGGFFLFIFMDFFMCLNFFKVG